MTATSFAATLVQLLTPVAFLATEGEVPVVEINDERVLWHLPDPEEALVLHARLETEAEGRKADAAFHRHVQKRVAPVTRPAQLRLTLSDVLHRALANNFAIRVESYNPAIETTRVVEAEAAFDALFFLNVTNNKRDVPTTSVIQGTQSEAFTIRDQPVHESELAGSGSSVPNRQPGLLQSVRGRVPPAVAAGLRAGFQPLADQHRQEQPAHLRSGLPTAGA
jgi:hypothetical protein